MSKRKALLLAGSVIAFGILIACAVHFESTEYLYIASALPILIVLLLPDIRQNQFIVLKKNSGIRLIKQTEGQETLLVIEFTPGSILWDRTMLYFDLNQLSEARPVSKSSEPSASLSVLSFDLSLHPRKPNWIGIRLNQISERTRSLSYTTEEVTRLVIRMSDLEETAVQMLNHTGASAPGKSKSLQA
ncbi:hypothetical protein O9H85_25300 [Paenibacillus filicis]|uniref:DUF58 domain-containing protein n=1 Tax=Paenibacillus gyeongsangnamensis TaxID=3388067 RepID=A0ABT4QFL0_9BACL|nr:hypothetical protein [Paenibacillus filicis]MCZ8515667.1 hypothetical protein [Paenibacillus filicis]